LNQVLAAITPQAFDAEYGLFGKILEFSLKILYEAIWIKRSNKYDVKLIHILDKAKRENGGSYSTEDVENLKNITKLGPFLIAMIPY
jgi:hypothetical protein